MHFGVVLGIVLIAHSSHTDFAVACMYVLLLVDHIASPCIEHILAMAGIHAQLLQALGQAIPGVAGGHQLFSKLLGAHFQWPGNGFGDGLDCRSITIRCLL